LTYFPHSKNDISEMLNKIGLKDIDDLKKLIPANYWLKSLDIPSGKTELEAYLEFKNISDLNKNYKAIFLGAGAYNHYIPAAIDEIVSRHEFYTAYTPYQSEVSQGTLQAIFEYQTYVTNLTGMDVSNASMYDGATALAESTIMSIKTTGKNKILIDKFIHPEYIEVLKTYMSPLNVQIDIYESNPFLFDLKDFNNYWNDEYACYAFASPNFCGTVLDISKLADVIHNSKSSLIQVINEPLFLSIFKKPSDFDVDIVCGDFMSFGIPLSFGGPYLGFIACKKNYMRKLPGRIIGQTIDKNGKAAYILTLSAREQHIRRDGATSNICSNHNLCAIRAGIYLSLLGKNGLKECGLKNLENAQYLRDEINKLDNFQFVNEQTFFNEFVIKTDIEYNKLKKALDEADILSFLPLNTISPLLKSAYLICATELNTDIQINNLINTLRSL